MEVIRGVRGILAASACSIAALGLLAGCGEAKIELERPARMIEVSVRMGQGEVEVAPRTFGSGKVNITVLNMSPIPARLSVDGPTPLQTGLIQPGETATLRSGLEPGSYEAIMLGGDPVSPARFTVGPKRESSDSVLLLP